MPTGLVAANRVPSGYVVPKGWDYVVDSYKNVDNTLDGMKYYVDAKIPPEQVLVKRKIIALMGILASS